MPVGARSLVAVIAIAGLVYALLADPMWSLAGFTAYVSLMPVVLSYPRGDCASRAHVAHPGARQGIARLGILLSVYSVIALVSLLVVGLRAAQLLGGSDRGPWLWAFLCLAGILVAGLALTWSEVRGAPVRAAWLEPVALVLSLAVGISLGSVLELLVLDGGQLPLGGWGLCAVGAAAALLLSRMRVSQWLLGARLGPVIPVRTGPDFFRTRWSVSDRVLGVYAQEMLPKNSLLGPVENSYPADSEPSIVEAAESLAERVEEALQAGRMIMPGSETCIVAAEGKTDELIVAGGLLGSRLVGSSILVDNAGPGDGAYVRFRLSARTDEEATLDDAATPAHPAPSGDGCAHQLVAVKFSHSTDERAAQCAPTQDCSRGGAQAWCEIEWPWLKPEPWALAQAVAGISEKIAVPCGGQSPTLGRVAFAINGPAPVGFAVGATLGRRVCVGSARWSGSTYDDVEYPAEQGAEDHQDPLATQDQESNSAARRDRRTWFIRLISGSLLRTIALLMFGAILALSMEWAILGSEGRPPWGSVLIALALAVALAAAAWATDSGLTAPRFRLALADSGLLDDVGWRTRTISQPHGRAQFACGSVRGTADAEWIKRRLVDIYSAFPGCGSVEIAIPDPGSDQGHRPESGAPVDVDTERWKALGRELKDAFRGPKPLTVVCRSGTAKVEIHPRPSNDVADDSKKVRTGQSALESIVEGTRPKTAGK